MAKANLTPTIFGRHQLIDDADASGFIREAIGRAYPGVTATDRDLREFTRSLTQAGDPRSLHFVQELERLCVLHVDDEQVVDQTTVATLLLECGSFYENVGESAFALRVAELALSIAEQICDTALQRRSHNFVAAIYARAYDFVRACEHMERALVLANQMQDPLFIMACLANTVAILEAMGLLHAARDIALKATSQPRGGCHLEYLHLVNASNGLHLSNLIGDLKSATLFYDRCSETLVTSAPVMREVTRAHYDAAAATHLSTTGRESDAIKGLDVALARCAQSSNKRIQALLLCAQAEVRIHIKSRDGITQSKSELTKLLSDTKDLPSHREDVLRVLVKLYATTRARKPANLDRRNAAVYLRLLREHLLSVKHRKLFQQASYGLASSDPKISRWDDPSYKIPPWIRNLGTSGENNESPDGAKYSATDKQLQELPSSVARYDGPPYEFNLRSRQYDIAENWTVAAELVAGGDGRHCFRVGRLVSAIASALNIRARECVVLELASRLHDIGKVGMSFPTADSSDLMVVSDFSSLAEHTLLGQRILGTSTDRILQVAHVVAKTHHECWNGSGFPVGLKGQAIPIEGRICSIADAFISLIRPRGTEYAWPVSTAVRQIESMSGMQLDPSLISPFLRVIGEEFLYEEGALSGAIESPDERVRAKIRLLDTLDLENVA